jgi:SAM-dependent methyltransferase
LSAPEEFTGERYLPGVVGEIAYEHCHRYAFARRFVAGRRVLDAACGEGYGSALLAEAAQHVVGVDIDAAVVASASSRYGGRGNVEFRAASVTSLPLADASVDAVVSFETIEHLEAADQPAMLAEFARVLAPDGLLILSSPNRPEYSDARRYANPFHRAELDREELAARLAPAFPAGRWFGQRRYMGSAIWGEGNGDRYEALSGSAAGVHPAALPAPLYFIVIAARNTAALPQNAPALSLYADGDDSEWTRVDREAREVLRLDAELREQHREAQELRAMVEYRDRKLDERERAYAQLDNVVAQERAAHRAERERLMRQIEAQERIVAYRASVRWWFLLPLERARRVWTRIRAA